jgi:TonB family protein
MRRPNTRVQRTRSSPSAHREPLTRRPLGARNEGAAVALVNRPVLSAGLCLASLAIALLLAPVSCSTASGGSARSRATPLDWEGAPFVICAKRPSEACENLAGPRPLSTPAPFYPSGDGGLAPRGVVVLTGEIGTDGTVMNLDVLKSDDGRLVPPSVAAVRAWRFEPAKCAGRPIGVTLSITLDFQVGGSHVPTSDCEWSWEL